MNEMLSALDEGSLQDEEYVVWLQDPTCERLLQETPGAEVLWLDDEPAPRLGWLTLDQQRIIERISKASTRNWQEVEFRTHLWDGAAPNYERWGATVTDDMHPHMMAAHLAGLEESIAGATCRGLDDVAEESRREAAALYEALMCRRGEIRQKQRLSILPAAQSQRSHRSEHCIVRPRARAQHTQRSQGRPPPRGDDSDGGDPEPEPLIASRGSG
jgi:hypothetical protein